MSLVVSTLGELALMNRLVGELNTYTLKLFKSNTTPVIGTVAGDFTEANFAGYASQTLTTWGSAFTNATPAAESDEAVHTFTCTGSSPSNDIYGYYVVNGAGTLIFSERAASAPFTVNQSGVTYSVTPKMTLTYA